MWAETNTEEDMIEQTRAKRLRDMPLPNFYIDGNIPTRAWQARGCLSWAKIVLLTELAVGVENRESGGSPVLCEVNTCGLDVGKYMRAGVKHLVCVEPRNLWKEEAKRKFTARQASNGNMTAEYVPLDLTAERIPGKY